MRQQATLPHAVRYQPLYKESGCSAKSAAEATVSHRILVINPGSTSTKLAVYDDEKEVLTKSLAHPAKEIAGYALVADQFEMRKEQVLSFLDENGFDAGQLSAVVGRGGMLPPVKSGAYLVNEAMVKRLRFNPVMEHASNLGALIAYEIAKSIGVNAYIYDSVKVDEMIDVARVTGVPEIQRNSVSHVLNSRAMAMKCAAAKGMAYDAVCIVVAHLGGGISVTLHDHGRLADVIPDTEGPFSPERCGRVAAVDLAELCYSGKYDRAGMRKHLRGNGGIKAYLGTEDIRDVLQKSADGDAQASLLLDAMCYQVAKGIGELATVVCGKVDFIVLTGGIAYSDLITSKIKERVRFIAPVEVLPGENEMESLAKGTLRVLRGEEQAHNYCE